MDCGPTYNETAIDIVLDDEMLLKMNMNTGRAAGATMMSTNRRSPRYIGEYEETEEDGKKTKRQ